LAQALEVEDLPRNPVDSPWESKEAYLSAQYQLLRREGIEGLRYAVNRFRADPVGLDDEFVCVYRRVCITQYRLLQST